MGDHLAISGGGLLQAPLNPLKTDVLRGPPGLSRGPGPLGPHRNSTTDQNRTKGALLACRRDALNWSSLLTIELNKLCGRPLRGDANTARWL